MGRRDDEALIAQARDYVNCSGSTDSDDDREIAEVVLEAIAKAAGADGDAFLEAVTDGLDDCGISRPQMEHVLKVYDWATAAANRVSQAITVFRRKAGHTSGEDDRAFVIATLANEQVVRALMCEQSRFHGLRRAIISALGGGLFNSSEANAAIADYDTITEPAERRKAREKVERLRADLREAERELERLF